jgi:hypothetical protein
LAKEKEKRPIDDRLHTTSPQPEQQQNSPPLPLLPSVVLFIIKEAQAALKVSTF